MRSGGGAGIVGHHDNGFTFVTGQRLKKGKNAIRGFTIEVSCRLIRHQQRGISNKRAGDGDTLLLPAGKLGGRVVGTIHEPDEIQRLLHSRPALGSVEGCDEQGQLDVFESGQHWDEVIELEDVADLL